MTMSQTAQSPHSIIPGMPCINAMHARIIDGAVACRLRRLRRHVGLDLVLAIVALDGDRTRA